jgi:cation transport regulator ChaB
MWVGTPTIHHFAQWLNRHHGPVAPTTERGALLCPEETMPYASVSELPSGVKSRYSTRCQRVFLVAFNSEYKRSKSEGRAMAVGHTAAKKCTEST